MAKPTCLSNNSDAKVVYYVNNERLQSLVNLIALQAFSVLFLVLTENFDGCWPRVCRGKHFTVGNVL